VGTLRIIYSIDDEAQIVTVVRVARRSESTYRKLRDE
jgi:mRNA-degrading endonuclease RelE of RelBE toxin-antitoxin system